MPYIVCLVPNSLALVSEQVWMLFCQICGGQLKWW